MAFSKTHAWSVFKYLYNQLSLSQLFLIFFSSFLMNYSYSTFTFSLSVTILSLPLPFPPISHSRLTIAVADFVMCPFFPFCSWQILYFFIYFLSIPLNSFQGADFIWTIFCPLSNPFQHECISAPSIKSSSQIIEKSCCPHLVLVQFECNCTCAYFLLCAIIDIHHLIDALIE